MYEFHKFFERKFFVIIIIRRDSDNSTNKYFAIISFREIFFYGKLFK